MLSAKNNNNKKKSQINVHVKVTLYNTVCAVMLLNAKEIYVLSCY